MQPKIPLCFNCNPIFISENIKGYSDGVMTTLDGMCCLVDNAGYLMCVVCLLCFYSSGTLKVSELNTGLPCINQR